MFSIQGFNEEPTVASVTSNAMHMPVPLARWHHRVCNYAHTLLRAPLAEEHTHATTFKWQALRTAH